MIFGLIFGIILGGLILYLFLKPKLNQVIEINTKRKEEVEQLEKDYQQAKQNYLIAIDNKQKEEQKYNSLLSKRTELENNLTILKEQFDITTNTMYEKAEQLANEKMSAAADKMSQEYQKAQSEAEEEYANCLIELVNEFNSTLDKIKIAETRLSELESKVKSGVEAAKRREEIDKQADFYRLCLSDIDLEEISKLREVGKILRDAEPLNKVIWKVYYEKPYTDLIGRVVGNGRHTGIYKITHIASGKCYVGQCQNAADRWRQHIKRGIGADTPTKNKLYPAMLEFGVENFTFEWIEDCLSKDLDSREDYWQDYFGAREFGYSIK